MFQMWTIDQASIEHGICMGILIILAVIDIRSREIPVRVLIAVNVMALGFRLWGLLIEKGDIILIAGGIGIGVLFCFISKVTGESVGYGDSWVILILGIWLGVWKLLEVLAGAFLLLAAASIICLTVKKMSRKCRIPFLPFLAAGYLFVVFG